MVARAPVSNPILKLIYVFFHFEIIHPIEWRHLIIKYEKWIRSRIIWSCLELNCSHRLIHTFFRFCFCCCFETAASFAFLLFFLYIITHVYGIFVGCVASDQRLLKRCYDSHVTQTLFFCFSCSIWNWDSVRPFVIWWQPRICSSAFSFCHWFCTFHHWLSSKVNNFNNFLVNANRMLLRFIIFFLFAVTGHNLYVVNGVVCSCCIIYTMMVGRDTRVARDWRRSQSIYFNFVSIRQGGIKAVVWTDVVQAGVMVISIVLIACYGIASVGGLTEVWNRAVDGGRLFPPM